MDMFMDKLAQKMTAQEIIKANTAADTEELNRLKSQLEEYNECLAKLKKLIEQGELKLKSFQADRGELEHLVQENRGGIQEAQARAERNGEKLAGILQESEKNLQERLEAIGASTDESVHKECVKVYRNVQAVVVEESGKQIKAAEEARSAATAAGAKTGVILGVSVAALIFSLAGLALQILNMWNITFLPVR